MLVYVCNDVFGDCLYMRLLTLLDVSYIFDLALKSTITVNCLLSL